MNEVSKMVRSTSEFLILPKGAIDSNVSVLTNKSQKIWNPVVKKQFYNKLLKAKETRQYHTNDDLKVEVHFQNGTIATYLFVPCNFTLFQVHEAIRAAFEENIKTSRNVSFNLNYITQEFPVTEAELVDALSSLVTLSIWQGPNYETIYKPTSGKKPKYGFYTSLPREQVAKIIAKAEIKAAATNQVRTLAILPPNKLESKDLVEFSLARARRLKVESRFINFETLKEMGAGAFCAVLQASRSSGGIVVLKRPGNDKEIVFVGKGVTFDTGGMDLKTDSSMFGMHRDMTGAALALSAFETLVRTDRKSTIHCYLAIGENLLSTLAYKPGDVLKMLCGQTIEIENTDAEGRLMLADTLTLANREVGAGALVIDFATLTGSAPDVLSTRWSIAMTKKEELWNTIIQAGKKSGERIHPLPILEEFQDAVTSGTKIADYSQCTGYSTAEHCYAAAFLSEFIDDDKYHIHVDLSSETADDGLGLVSSTVTGFGIRWAIEFVERFHRLKASKTNKPKAD
jgi:leucyl aminopeptidase